ncbi:hypothetical protein F2Q69_00045249 [Brassica cretica]|uniref:Uncharacterized protein n=1 Tax=Brassica cretica TaxID=69181 RepID=A0A8S9NEA9_BRACR|nr:hypothetical protein F2Q69_00045249 [Brassica cretica]
MPSLRFVASFFVGSLYYILVITISSTAAAAPLCISAVHAPMFIAAVHAPLVVVNSSSLSSPPSPTLPSSSPSPPPRSFSPFLSMLPEAPNLLSWRVSSPYLLPSPSQTTIAIGGASFTLANLLSAPLLLDPLAFTSSQPLTLLLLVTAAVKAPLPHFRSHRSLRFRWQYYFNVNNLSPAPGRRSFSNGTTPPPRTIVTPHHLFTIDTISA